MLVGGGWERCRPRPGAGGVGGDQLGSPRKGSRMGGEDVGHARRLSGMTPRGAGGPSYGFTPDRAYGTHHAGRGSAATTPPPFSSAPRSLRSAPLLGQRPRRHEMTVAPPCLVDATHRRPVLGLDAHLRAVMDRTVGCGAPAARIHGDLAGVGMGPLPPSRSRRRCAEHSPGGDCPRPARLRRRPGRPPRRS